ncbi:hypothetical protein WN944_021979 [Citrus x changshan-huyou]|uniref:Uncharacterized protein n=1 Tax=Citrus x changshan-huyou TaxID=2935761 RepID=A0AAP0MXP8_9ROSI
MALYWASCSSTISIQDLIGMAEESNFSLEGRGTDSPTPTFTQPPQQSHHRALRFPHSPTRRRGTATLLAVPPIHIHQRVPPVHIRFPIQTHRFRVGTAVAVVATSLILLFPCSHRRIRGVVAVPPQMKQVAW